MKRIELVEWTLRETRRGKERGLTGRKMRESGEGGVMLEKDELMGVEDSENK